jgi:uncharacterized glyoxalase superfamily protein PhnB
MFKKMTPNLMVPDVDEATEFYRGILGFEVLVTVPETTPRDFALLQRGDVELMLQSKRSLETDLPTVAARSVGAASIICYIEVADVAALYDAVRQRVHVVKPLASTFYGMSEFYVQDPHGYVFCFAERTK